VLVPAAARVRLVVLLHMPATGAADRERAVLAAAAAVVATSDATRRLLIGRDALDPGAVHVAEPGVDAAPVASGTTVGGALLSVAAVTPGKGHDVLLDALSGLRDLAWRCVCVGSLTRDPGWAARTLRQAQVAGLDDRVEFPGARVGPALAASYAGADALVLATRAESYGMVAAEALARGIPVIGSDVGGLPDTVGRTRDGRVPGLLVPPGDAPALAHALRRWLEDDALRHDLRAAARERRDSLRPWAVTTDRVQAVLAGLLTGVAA
jgi:glycosyltransferase involved in cell wall biosynthesis